MTYRENHGVEELKKVLIFLGKRNGFSLKIGALNYDSAQKLANVLLKFSSIFAEASITNH
jgi:hypothetical protein